MDRVNKEVLVRGNGGILNHYKYDGTLVFHSKWNHPYYILREFSFYDGIIWATSRLEAIKDTKDYEIWLLRLNSRWEIQDSIRLYRPNLPIGMVLFNDDSFSLVDDRMYVNVPSVHIDPIRRDTLYQVVGSQLVPILRVNYGHYFFNNVGSPRAIAYGDPIHPGSIRQNQRYLFALYGYFESPNEYLRYIFCYDFFTKKQYNLKDGFKDDIYHSGQISSLRPLDVTNNEYFYTKLPDELSESFPERDEEDNPVLFILTLKK